MMGERFTRALVRQPSDAYAGCLRPGNVAIDPARARVQHLGYVTTLRRLGVDVRELQPLDLPDAVFVEDTAVAIGGRIVLARPGAVTRRQEIFTVADFFEEEGTPVARLEDGTLDGGDVMKVGGYVLIGLSERTDATGAEALGAHVRAASMTPVQVPVVGRIHLKSAASPLDAVTVLAAQGAELPELPGVRILRAPEGEEAAANCVAVGRSVIMSQGNPRTEALLSQNAFTPVAIDLGEFEKGLGGPTCLSLRF